MTHPSNASEPVSNHPPRFKRLRRWIKIGLAGYLLSILGCSMFQEKLIFPGAATQGQADAIVAETATTSLVKLSLKEGTPVVARFDLATGVDWRQAPTVLLFYGNGQCAQTTGGVIYIFQQLGCNVLTPDYPGYGMSGGSPTQKGCYETADLYWKYLQSRADINQSELHIVGWSLGTGVAIDLASRTDPKTLTTISAYTSMTDMGYRRLPILPIGLIIKHPFRSIDKIEKVKCPILMIHGSDDHFIPPDMTRKLATRAKSPVKLLFVPGRGHNDIFDLEGDAMTDALYKQLHGND